MIHPREVLRNKRVLHSQVLGRQIDSIYQFRLQRDRLWVLAP